MARTAASIAILLSIYYRKSIEMVRIVWRFPEMDEDEVESKRGEPDLSCYSLFLSRRTWQQIYESVKRQV
jgi:hypothetical protein